MRPKWLRNEKKKYTLRRHFKKRLLQRFGINIDKSDYKDLVRKIKKGQLKCMGRQSNRVTVFLCDISGKTLVVFYDTHRHELITAITEEQYHAGKDGTGPNIRLL